MLARKNPVISMIALVSLVLLMTGCGDKTFFVAGNTVSMVVACMLFWSTLKLNRGSAKSSSKLDEVE